MKVQKQLFIAQSGAGKTYAAEAEPNNIADIDWALFRMNNVDGKLQRELNPSYPLNWLQALVQAFQTHNTVTTPNADDSIGLVQLLRRGDFKNNRFNTQQVNKYVSMLITHASEKFGQKNPKQKMSAEQIKNAVNRLCSKENGADLQNALCRLKQIDFESIIAIPDENCRDEFIERISKRNQERLRSEAENGKIINGSHFKGVEAASQGFIKGREFCERALKTGLFLKLPINQGQTFYDAYKQNKVVQIDTNNEIEHDSLNLF